ncbi:RNF34 [Acanthosepion pharaonis]|uniref:RNF34 n=1 Tax=Acanthosepion pharaonis TaxID=158019 RepID=A0A812CS29_ACAPH|nr:RNF34 [Sepia pharaonis]
MGAGVVKAQEQWAHPINITTTTTAAAQFSPNSEEGLLLSNRTNMSCESCAVQFTTFKRKKTCYHCGRHFCSSCCQRQWNNIQLNRQCRKCQILTSGNFTRNDLMQWKVKDLQVFLRKKNISTSTCTEKHDLVELLLRHFGNYIEYQTNIDTQLDQQNSQTAHVPPSSNNSDSTEGRAGEDVQPLSGSSSWNSSNGSQRQTQEPDVDVQSAVSPNFSPSKPAYMNLDTFENIEAVANLTVKELKEILSFHFVDYKGCVEKWELLDRVRRLWEEQKQQKKDLESPVSNEEETCKICMDATIDCVLLECGHMVSCTQCGRKLNECPICRQFVVRAVHIFKA